MTTSSMIQNCFCFGFQPTIDEIILHYLPLKLLGQLPPLDYLRDCVIFGENSDEWRQRFQETGAKRLFFFSQVIKKNLENGTRKERRTSGGTWKCQKDSMVLIQGNHVGSVRNFTFVSNKDADSQQRWVLHEYRVDGQLLDQIQKDDYVVCQIKKMSGKKVKEFVQECQEGREGNMDLTGNTGAENPTLPNQPSVQGDYQINGIHYPNPMIPKIPNLSSMQCDNQINGVYSHLTTPNQTTSMQRVNYVAVNPSQMAPTNYTNGVSSNPTTRNQPSMQQDFHINGEHTNLTMQNQPSTQWGFHINNVSSNPPVQNQPSSQCGHHNNMAMNFYGANPTLQNQPSTQCNHLSDGDIDVVSI